MQTANCKITIHMVSSLDGIIAKKDNSVAWFETADHYEKGVELTQEDTAAFLSTIDCYVMGANTYLHALELSRLYGWAYGDTPVMVAAHNALPVERPTVELYAGDLETLVKERLQPHYKNVWLVGGAQLAKAFLQHKLADEIRLSIMPVLLGEGTPFWGYIGEEQRLHLIETTAYKSGMVELWYAIKKD